MATIVSTIWWRDLSVPQPDKLAYIYPRAGGTIPIRGFAERFSPLFSTVTAHSPLRAVVSFERGAERLMGEVVNADYFLTLGLIPAAGRLFQPIDDLATEDQLIVLSHEFWVRRLGSDPSAIGTFLRLDGQEFRVIGIAPAGFAGLMAPWEPSSYWVTFRHHHGTAYQGGGAYLVARLRAGVTSAQASAALRDNSRDGAQSQRGYRLLPVTGVITPFDPARGQEMIGVASAAGLGLALMFVVIGLANIVGLLSSMGRTRRGEFATRISLGATFGRIARQLFVEAAVLSGLAAVAGLSAAYGLLRLYATVSPTPYLVSVHTNWSTIASVATLALCQAVVITIIAMRQLASVRRRRLTLAPRESGATDADRSRASWFLVPQILLSTVCLVVAAAYVVDLTSFTDRSAGFQHRDVVTMRLSYWTGETTSDQSATANGATRGQRSRQFFADVRDRLSRSPDVLAVGLASRTPIEIGGSKQPLISRQSMETAGPGSGRAHLNYVSAGYFGALSIPLIHGDDFPEGYASDSVRVAIVSRSLARQLWPHGDAVGQDMAFHLPDRSVSQLEWLQVVGVVGDVMPAVPVDKEYPMVYLPTSQMPFADSFPLNLLIKGKGDAPELLARLRREVMMGYALAEVSDVQPLSTRVDTMLYPKRVLTWLVTACGVSGLGLASVGLFASLSYAVTLRRRELAIRTALGESVPRLVMLVLRPPAWFLGLAIPVALLLGRLAVELSASFVGASPPVPFSMLAGVGTAVFSVSAIACAWPAVTLVRSLTKSVTASLKA